jgi:hypothetical protein
MRGFTGYSRVPSLANTNASRYVDYQLDGGRVISGARLRQLLARPYSSTYAAASLVALGETVPVFIRRQAADELLSAPEMLPEWAQR